MSENMMKVVWSLFCIAVYLGIPTGFWILLDPSTFWQRLFVVGGTLVYAVIGGFIAFLIWMFGFEEIKLLY